MSYTVLSVLLAAAAAAGTAPSFAARAWPAADRLFSCDPHWLGGDVAASVDLGNGRVLWLFGDSFVGLDSTRQRTASRMVRNTVAVQHGYDPTRADITFHWSEGPEAIFRDTVADTGLWPTHGCLVDSLLVVFLLRVRNVDTGLGFEIAGWCAALVANPQDEPGQWDIGFRELPGVPMVDVPVAGSGGALVSGDWLYAFVTADPQRHDTYLLRWARAEVALHEMDRPEWWTPGGWQTADSLTAAPERLFGGSSDFSVHYDSGLGQYIAVEARGFGWTRLSSRAARSIQGPWSEPRVFWIPADYYQDGLIIYSANAHPELTGDGLAVTFNVNSTDFAELVRNQGIYLPKFVLAAPARD